MQHRRTSARDRSLGFAVRVDLSRRRSTADHRLAAGRCPSHRHRVDPRHRKQRHRSRRRDGNLARPAGHRASDRPPRRQPAGGRARRRTRSASQARRAVPRLSRSRLGSDRDRGRQSARVRRSEGARGSAGGDRSREDGVLYEHQPRVPHAAHADARSGRGDPRAARGDFAARPRTAGGCASQHASPAEARQRAARLFPHRRRSRAGVVSPDRSRWAYRGTGQRIRIGNGARRLAISRRRRAARGAVLDRPRHVGEDRPQSPLQRAQVHARRRNRSASARGRARRDVDCARHWQRDSGERAATPLRTLSPHRRDEAAQPGGNGNRIGAGAGAGQTARRHDRGVEPRRRRNVVSRHDSGRHRAPAARAHRHGSPGRTDIHPRRLLRRRGHAVARRR